MADFKIEAEVRTITGKKVKRVRAAGMVPVIVYGPKIEPMSLQIPYRPLEIALMQAGGTNIIDIMVDGNATPVLARDVQRDVLKHTIKHVDFFAVDMAATIVADIPVNLIGESPAVVAREGILVTGTNSLAVEALPANLINEITIDISKLENVGDSILVSDLDLNADLKILNDPTEMLATVSQPAAARAELVDEMDEALEEEIPEGAEPEVISRGKDEEDEEDE